MLSKRTMLVGWGQWHMPVTVPAQEAEIWRILIQGQPKQTVSKTTSQPIKSWV
jgi:hypothetical protein